MPCPDPEVVQALADGTLAPEQRASLLGHAEECESCRRLVAEVVREPSRTGTIVLDEIRRGYRRQGRLFRYAQVRVAKP